MGDLLTGPQPPPTTAIKALLRRTFKSQARTEPTPSFGGSRLKEHFPDSRIVILPHIGHELDIGISGTGCLDTMMLNVVERATTKGLNTTLCNSAIVFPPIPLTG